MTAVSLGAGTLDRLRNVVALCSGPPDLDVAWEVLDAVEELIGCDWVAFNGHDTPGRRLYHSQVVASGEREQATSEDLAGGQDDERFWRWYWACDPCSMPDRVDKPLVLSISEFYDEREWTRHPMYVEYVGCEEKVSDELLVTFPDGPGRTRRLLLARTGGSRFDDDARFMMTLLQPHLGPLLAGVIARPHTGAALTERQWEVLRLVRLGLANKQIARILGMAPGTVRKHLENVYERLGVHSRTAAVLAATADDPQRR